MPKTDGTLSGTLTGASQHEILERVKEAARTYFGVQCVIARLSNERIEVEGFAADYEACVWHVIDRPAYGPGVCQGCRLKDWPHDPLNAEKKWHR